MRELLFQCLIPESKCHIKVESTRPWYKCLLVLFRWISIEPIDRKCGHKLLTKMRWFSINSQKISHSWLASGSPAWKNDTKRQIVSLCDACLLNAIKFYCILKTFAQGRTKYVNDIDWIHIWKKKRIVLWYIYHAACGPTADNVRAHCKNNNTNFDTHWTAP